MKTSLTSLLIPTLLIFSTGLSAQIQTSGTTKKVIGITARTGKTSSYRSIPANQPFAGFFALRATSAGTAGSTSVSNLASNGKVQIRVGENGNAQSLSSTSSAEVRTSKTPNFPIAPHAFAFRLKAPKLVFGKLIVTIDGSGTKGAFALMSVKVGSTTLTWTLGKPKVQKTIPVVIPSAGLMFTTSSFARASVTGKGTASYSMHASILFEANSQPSCTVLPYGRSCALLMGKAQKAPNGTLLTLTTSGSLSKALGFTVAGLTQFKIPLPGSPCSLLTNILVLTGPFTTNAVGAATHNILLPSNLKASFNLQDIVFRPGTVLSINSTNGLAVVCR